MTRKVFAVAALAIFCMSMPLLALTASATNAPIGNQVQFGDVTGPIRGTIDHTNQFDMVPGEEFSFDVFLKNISEYEITSNVLVRLDMPNGGQMNMYNEDVTLGSMENTQFNYSQMIPDGVQLYGRYTMKLFIDNGLADFFQFDMNARNDIIVRWDDGVMANAYAWYDAGSRWAIRGCMPAGATIKEICADMLSPTDDFWPWPDAVQSPVDLQVYDASYNLVYSSGPVVADDYACANPMVAAPQPHFFVAEEQLGAYPDCDGQNVDDGLNHYDQMYAYVAGAWENYTSISGDLMIWASGTMANGAIVTTGSAPVQ